MHIHTVWRVFNKFVHFHYEPSQVLNFPLVASCWHMTSLGFETLWILDFHIRNAQIVFSPNSWMECDWRVWGKSLQTVHKPMARCRLVSWVWHTPCGSSLPLSQTHSQLSRSIPMTSFSKMQYEMIMRAFPWKEESHRSPRSWNPKEEGFHQCFLNNTRQSNKVENPRQHLDCFSSVQRLDHHAKCSCHPKSLKATVLEKTDAQGLVQMTQRNCNTVSNWAPLCFDTCSLCDFSEDKISFPLKSYIGT
jgi:hypothetical protein